MIVLIAILIVLLAVVLYCCVRCAAMADKRIEELRNREERHKGYEESE